MLSLVTPAKGVVANSAWPSANRHVCPSPDSIPPWFGELSFFQSSGDETLDMVGRCRDGLSSTFSASMYTPKGPLPAAKTKNLFLRDRRGRRHFLVTVGYEKAVDLKALASFLGVSKLGFASVDRLQRYLGVDPGSVSILGVVNDVNRAVEVIVDEDLWVAKAFQCHPLVNTSTLVISRDDIQRILEITGHPARVLNVPSRG